MLQYTSIQGTAALLLALPLVVVGPTAASSHEADAWATLENRDGETVGTVMLRETPNGVLVYASFTGLPPGSHAFHFHETGQCEPPFKSAGGMGLITGRKAFQRPMSSGVELLNAVQDVYLSDTVTLA